jgi:hypothetical protein
MSFVHRLSFLNEAETTASLKGAKKGSDPLAGAEVAEYKVRKTYVKAYAKLL